MEMEKRIDIVCKTCGEEYFYVLHSFSLGSNVITTFELLKCFGCGRMQLHQYSEES